MMLPSCQFADCFFQAPLIEEAVPAAPVDRDVYWDPCASDGQHRAAGEGAPFDDVAALSRLAA